MVGSGDQCLSHLRESVLCAAKSAPPLQLPEALLPGGLEPPPIFANALGGILGPHVDVSPAVSFATQPCGRAEGSPGCIFFENSQHHVLAQGTTPLPPPLLPAPGMLQDLGHQGNPACSARPKYPPPPTPGDPLFAASLRVLRGASGVVGGRGGSCAVFSNPHHCKHSPAQISSSTGTPHRSAGLDQRLVPSPFYISEEALQ